MTKKSQVLSPTQLLPLSPRMCVFLKCFLRFSWSQSVKQVAGKGKEGEKGAPGHLFFFHLEAPSVCTVMRGGGEDVEGCMGKRGSEGARASQSGRAFRRGAEADTTPIHPPHQMATR